jgi:hypothetical protein
VLLAFLSYVRVSPNGISYRKSEVWESKTYLLLTQHGFPWGRTVFPTTPASSKRSSPPFADPTRFSSLTDLYSQFANSDAVRQIMRKQGAPSSWKIVAAPMLPTLTGTLPLTGTTLPVISLAGQAKSAKDAVAAAGAGRRALIQFVETRQDAADIPSAQRIDLQILKRATRPVLIEPRKKTLPIVVFLAVVAATIGFAFVLENLRPRVRAVAPATSARRAGTRRTA